MLSYNMSNLGTCTISAYIRVYMSFISLLRVTNWFGNWPHVEMYIVLSIIVLLNNSVVQVYLSFVAILLRYTRYSVLVNDDNYMYIYVHESIFEWSFQLPKIPEKLTCMYMPKMYFIYLLNLQRFIRVLTSELKIWRDQVKRGALYIHMLRV